MYKYLLSAVMLFTMAACQQDELPGISGDNDPKTLQIDYTIEGADVVQMSRGIPSQPEESKVSRLLTLIFEYNESGEGLYIGHADSEGSAAGAGGTAKVTMPGNNDARNAYSMIVLGNFNTYSNIKPADFDTQFAGKKLNEVSAMLTASMPTTNSIGFNGWGHPMSVVKHKGAETNAVLITLRRMTCRVDIENKVSATPVDGGTFVLEGAQIWNVRTQTPILGDAATIASTGYVDFDKEWMTPEKSKETEITAKLYAFPNKVLASTATDKVSTCLIIKGRYNGNASSYYRVNVSPSNSSQQELIRNHIYSIKILKVTGDGATDPGQAFNKKTLFMSYTMNDWDNSYLGIYTFDADGNGLGASCREVSFADRAGQSVNIDILRYKSSTKPLPNDWTSVTATVGGEDAMAPNNFSATINPETGILTITTRNSNTSDFDYSGTVTLKWGTIIVPITLTQLNSKSQLHGITATPHSLWYGNAIETKQVELSLYGTDFTNVKVKYDVIGEGGWVQEVKLNTTLSDTPAGKYVYDIVTGKLPADEAYQTAQVRFTVAQGLKISTALISLTKSEVTLYKNEESWVRLLFDYPGYESDQIRWFDTKYYITQGGYTLKEDKDDNTVGLPEEERRGNHIHFNSVWPAGCMYRFKVRSMSKCSIVPKSQEGRFFEIKKESERLVAPQEYETIFLVYTRSEHNIDAFMAIEYEDGTTSKYTFHQKGVIETRGEEFELYRNYYYGTLRSVGWVWLDRNIGARNKGFYSSLAEGGNDDALPEAGMVNDITARGEFLDWKTNYCPYGFRTPTHEEWAYLGKNPNMYFYKTIAGTGAIYSFLVLPDSDGKPLSYLPLARNDKDQTKMLYSKIMNFLYTNTNSKQTLYNDLVYAGPSLHRCIRDPNIVTSNY
ncbi:MAG: hypothetical protein RSB34_07015 [Muribaculaceae bacterium]